MRDDLHLYGVGPRGAWLALRSLATLHTQQVARYVAAQEPGRGLHVIDVTPGRREPTYRQLRILPRYYTASPRPAGGQLGAPGEAWWYAVGMEDHLGGGYVLAGLVQERAPKLLTAAEAADALGITLPGVRSLLESFQLYPVYVGDQQDHRTRRMVFEAQVRARLSANVRTADAWRRIRAQLPDLARVDMLAEHVTITEPTPPVDPSTPTPLRQRETLAIGHEAGWYKVTGQARDGRFTIALPDGRTRDLPTRAVEPWLLGLADARGEGRRVVYGGDA